ncbi:MAG: nickel-dependent lactate racemase [Deltaproteobacteria bacterium]|nr:nickel-dependent lactate racemase [Deltaproteobacteria bacterium]
MTSLESIQLPWGKDTLACRLPRDWTVLGELSPRSREAVSDPATACREALSQPIGAAPLACRNLAGRRVVVVVDDHSRPTPVAEFIDPVLEELAAAGARPEQIDILLANGVHRESRPEEVAGKIGRENMARFRWRCHQAYDPAELAHLGRTRRGTPVFLNKLLVTADLLVCLGALEPHLLLGFGGGYKMLLPGCAGAQTIGRNHLQGVDPGHFDLVGAAVEASPMRQDLEEGAGLLYKDVFIVNAAMNHQARPTRFFCGDPILAHRAGTEFIEELAGIDIPKPADVVLTNSFPMDADLRQSAKCLGNTLYAAKPGGVILGCVKCDQGLGEMPVGSKGLPYPLVRLLARLIGKRRILPLVERMKRNEPVEEVFLAHFGLQMLRRNHLGLFSQNLPPALDKKLGLARVFDDVSAMFTWAAQKAPAGAAVGAFRFAASPYRVGNGPGSDVGADWNHAGFLTFVFSFFPITAHMM